MATIHSYQGALRTGSQAGPCIVIAVRSTMFPQQGTSGGTALPFPIGTILQSGTVGTAYSETISGKGGTAPYTFSVVSGALPAGLSLNSSSGVISGTPTTAGTASFTIKVSDAVGSTGTTAFQIIIAAASSGATNSGFVG